MSSRLTIILHGLIPETHLLCTPTPTPTPYNRVLPGDLGLS